MPKYRGGDLVEITVNHPELGNFKFDTKSNESYTFDPGGNRSADDANMVTGNGEFIDQINTVRWSFEGPIMADFSTNEQIKALQDLSMSPELGTWTFAHKAGTIWRGLGKFVGDISLDTNTAQLTGKIAGGGVLSPI